MRIVFIYSGAEHLGIEHLSSFLKLRGHQVSLLFNPAVFSGEISLSSQFLSRLFNVDKCIVKKLVTAGVIALNGIKTRDKRFFYLLKYIWTKKNTP